MTLYELDLLSVRHRRQQEREDRRAALSAWIVVNVNRDSAKKPEPFALDEVVAWLGYGGRRAADVAQSTGPPTPEELKERLGIVHMLHRGLYGENDDHAHPEGG